MPLLGGRLRREQADQWRKREKRKEETHTHPPPGREMGMKVKEERFVWKLRIDGGELG